MIRFAIPDVRVSDPSHAHYVSIAHLICDLEVRPDLRHDFKLFFIRFCGPQLLKVFDVEIREPEFGEHFQDVCLFSNLILYGRWSDSANVVVLREIK